MNGYFLLHGMFLQLAQSLNFHTCPFCRGGKVFRVQWKLGMILSDSLDQRKVCLDNLYRNL